MEDEKPTIRPSPPPAADHPERRVLIADDEPALLRGFVRLLKHAGFDVVACEDGNAAVEALMASRFDVILLDVNMPGTSGVDVLRIARAYDVDVPVILMTGGPDVGTAMQAVDLGALQYLVKPVANVELVRVVTRASRLHGIARVKREVLAELGQEQDEEAGRADLEAALDRALEGMTVVLQPIVSTGGKRVVGQEAFLRSPEPSLPDPPSVIAAAERLGRVHDVGRRVRALAAAAMEASGQDNELLFLNLHPLDLLDPELADAEGALGRIAERVVLEISERASLDAVRDIETRASILRYLGYRFALDDLGAGQVGLAGFSRLEPEFVKLDASLVRDVHKSPSRRKLCRAFITLCTELGATPIAEAVENAEEREALTEIGCDLMQGYLFGRPIAPPLRRVSGERAVRDAKTAPSKESVSTVPPRARRAVG